MTADAGFGRVAATAAIISLPLAAGNVLTEFISVKFNMNALSQPQLLLQQGRAAAEWWHWSMALDILGYYLFIVPLILWIRRNLLPTMTGELELSTFFLLGYCLVGAIGGAMVITTIPSLITDYATSGSTHREMLSIVFSNYSDAIYRGVWNILEEFLGGIGWIGLGLAFRGRYRNLASATLILGIASLIDSFGSTLNIDAITLPGLVVYLVLAPVWACWAGILILRRQVPEEPGPLTVQRSSNIGV